MKKYLLILISTFAIAQTNPTPFNKIKVTGATKKNDANRKVVQDSITKEYHWKLDNNGTVTNVTGTDGINVAIGATTPVIGINAISQSKITNLTTDLSGKVDKVSGKSLISDSEITRISSLSNYTHPANHPASIITQDAQNRFVSDTEKTAWNAKQTNLGYTPENISNKNISNGYAGLGSDGKLISSQLPSITISDTYVAASQAAMLGLTGAETGDVAVRTDLNKSYILKGSNYSILSDWQELLTPTSAVTTVFGRSGAITAQNGDYTATMVGAPNGSGNSTGTNTGDQTSVTGNAGTATVLQTARTINGVSFNGSSNITIADATKEPSFTKNTGFNKSFGTAVGTVAQGNDSRILNGQTAFGWGNHAGLYPSLTGTGANGTWGINISGNAGTATTATNSTQWVGQYYDNGGSDQNVSSFLTYNVNSNLWTKSSVGHVKTSLGLGSNAYNSTAYLPLSGNSTVNGIITTNGFKLGATDQISWGGGFNSGKPLIEGSVAGLNIYPKGNLNDGILNVVGSATFSSSVTATNFNGSATLTGTPTAPTASNGTNTNQIASTAFVNGAISNGVALSANSVTIGSSSTNTDFPIPFVSSGSSFQNIYNNAPITINPSTNLLKLSGSMQITGNVTSSGGFFNSDRRLKNILKRDGDVAYFKWKDGRDNKTHIGYIAQEVRKTNPDQVQKGENKMLSVNYVEILVEKIRLLEKRITELEKQK